jgi:hypothetical protein
MLRQSRQRSARRRVPQQIVGLALERENGTVAVARIVAGLAPVRGLVREDAALADARDVARERDVVEDHLGSAHCHSCYSRRRDGRPGFRVPTASQCVVSRRSISELSVRWSNAAALTAAAFSSGRLRTCSPRLSSSAAVAWLCKHWAGFYAITQPLRRL